MANRKQRKRQNGIEAEGGPAEGGPTTPLRQPNPMIVIQVVGDGASWVNAGINPHVLPNVLRYIATQTEQQHLQGCGDGATLAEHDHPDDPTAQPLEPHHGHRAE